MLRIFILTIFSTLFIWVNNKTFNCQFGKLYKNIQKPSFSKRDELLYDDSYNEKLKSGRLLQTSIRSPIRITLDTSNLNTIYTPTHGQSKTTSTNLNFLKKSMQVAEYFYQNRLKVSTISRVFAPTECQDFNPPSNDVSNGISSSDLHIYVRHITDQTKGYGATGKACKFVQKSLPDPTFQHGRPTVGRIIYNTYQIIDKQTVLTNRLFATITATTLHELMHVLGFDYSLYGTYIDPSTQNVYSTAPTTDQVTLNSNRIRDHYLMRTPNVLQWARAHFNCTTLAGMPLQNEEGLDDPNTVPSHWQRVSIYDELMTGTSLGAQKGFTGLTFALLKDMGWYQVDDTFNQTTNYGYHLQCPFVEDACYGSNTYNKYFCDSVAMSQVSQCSTTFLGKAVCSKQTGWMTDGCGIFVEYMSCVDPSLSGDSYKPYTLQQYETDSFCVKSTLGNVGISEKLRGRCYQYDCFSNYVNFYIGNYIVRCQEGQEGTQKTVNSLQGYLQCPDFASFCDTSRKICKNWCSGNGFCTRGVCNCLEGYYGEDCSKTSCSTGQYWDKKSASCVTQCPSGTYQNKFSHACEFCVGCQQCRDQPSICTGCLSTVANPLYFYQPLTQCYQQCPSFTYQAGDFCIDCNLTDSHCLTCSMDPDNCTSCDTPSGSNTYYLESNICVQVCANNKYDIVNNECITSCRQNLKDYPGTQCPSCPSGVTVSSYCDYCRNGEYKLISNQSCVPSCPSKYYENNDDHFCQRCDQSCQQCEGPYAQNCTSCSESSSFKYLLLTMCVSSCPRGYYPSQSQLACIICPTNSNCATCQLDASSNVICLTCKYGFYLKSDASCSSTCPQYYYKNKWNYTCDSCSSSCGDCLTSADSSCTNCRSPKFFLNNITGGYCMSECPTQLYTESGQNCLSCYQTCLTCEGVNFDDCLSCNQGYFLSNGLCRYVCPAGTFQNNETRTCDTCNSNCTFCFGQTIDNCTACISGLVLDNFTCSTECSHNLTTNQWGVCSQLNINQFNLLLTFISIILVYWIQ